MEGSVPVGEGASNKAGDGRDDDAYQYQSYAEGGAVNYSEKVRMTLRVRESMASAELQEQKKCDRGDKGENDVERVGEDESR